MKSSCTYLLAGILVVSSLCWAEFPETILTFAEYHSTLDQLNVASQQLDSSTRVIPIALRNLPHTWKVKNEDREFGISTSGLRQELAEFEKENNAANADAIRASIADLQRSLDGFERAVPSSSDQRRRLSDILSRPEFRDVHGPTAWERLEQRLLGYIVRALTVVFGSGAIPIISSYVVYALAALAVLALGYFAYRQIKAAAKQESVVPAISSVSSKSWPRWLAEAQSEAEQGRWREAVRLAYWAAIALLEQRGAWRPDRARTPREYLRLLAVSSEHREDLALITRIFEAAWYAKREVDANSFREAIGALERLGCQSS